MSEEKCRILESDPELCDKLRFGLPIKGVDSLVERLELAEKINRVIPSAVLCPLLCVPSRVEDGDEVVDRFLNLFCQCSLAECHENASMQQHVIQCFMNIAEDIRGKYGRSMEPLLRRIPPRVAVDPLFELADPHRVAFVAALGLHANLDEDSMRYLESVADLEIKLKLGLKLEASGQEFISLDKRMEISEALRAKGILDVQCPLLMLPSLIEMGHVKLAAYVREMLPTVGIYTNIANRLAVKFVEILEQVEVNHPLLIECIPSQLREYLSNNNPHRDEALMEALSCSLTRTYPDPWKMNSRELVEFMDANRAFDPHEQLDLVYGISNKTELMNALMSSEVSFEKFHYGIPFHRHSSDEVIDQNVERLVPPMLRFRLFRWFNSFLIDADSLKFPLFVIPTRRLLGDSRHKVLSAILFPVVDTRSNVTPDLLASAFNDFFKANHAALRRFEEYLDAAFTRSTVSDITSIILNALKSRLEEKLLSSTDEANVGLAFGSILEDFDEASSGLANHLLHMVCGDERVDVDNHISLDVININPRVDKDKYLGCYTCVAQSSCSGKTRLALEKKQSENILIVNMYVTCLEKLSSNYPKPDEFDISFVKKLMSAKSENEVTAMLGRLVVGMKRDFLEEDVCSGGTFYYLKNPDGKCAIRLSDLSPQTRAFVFRGDDTHDDNNIAWVANELEFLNRIYENRNRQRRVLFSVFFDEANALLDSKHEIIKALPRGSEPVSSPLIEGTATPRLDHVEETESITTFRLIRRSIYNELKSFWYCPLVFMDTTTRLMNFLPWWVRDNSARTEFAGYTDDTTRTPKKLFDPYIYKVSWNAYAKYVRNPATVENWLLYVNSYEYRCNLCLFGRPQWGAMLAAKHGRPQIEQRAALDSIASVASKKLYVAVDEIDLTHPQDLEVKMTCIASSVAIMALSVGLDAHMVSMHSEALVRTWMCKLLDFSREFSQLKVTYPPEPVLSIAASHLLTGDPATILNSVRQALYNTSMAPGPAGELVAHILLLLCKKAADFEVPSAKVPPKNDYVGRLIQPLPVKTFLERLLDPNAYEGIIKRLLENPETKKVVEGSVCFSHFLWSYGEEKDITNVLNYALSMNCAIQTPFNHTGIDLIIPVIMGDGKLAVLNVQVKNAKDVNRMEVCRLFAKSYLRSTGIPALNIMINVQQKSQDTTTAPSYLFNYNEAGNAKGKALATDDTDAQGQTVEEKENIDELLLCVSGFNAPNFPILDELDRRVSSRKGLVIRDELDYILQVRYVVTKKSANPVFETRDYVDVADFLKFVASTDPALRAAGKVVEVAKSMNETPDDVNMEVRVNPPRAVKRTSASRGSTSKRAR